MITAGVGWVIMLYGVLAEPNTGLPDGTGCSLSPTDEACMYNSERNGLIAWAVTLGLGALGVVSMTAEDRAVLPVRRRGSLLLR